MIPLQFPRWRIRAVFLLMVLVFSHDAWAARRNVILFVGDGMGPAWVTATRYEKISRDGKALFLDQLPHTAIVKTYSADRTVTDSAAAATALASGVKTKNYFIGKDPKKRNMKTIAEIAKEKGLAVGILTTTRLTHATPAAFYSHVEHRNQEKEIARQLLNSEFDLFLGGGAKDFNRELLKGQKRFHIVRTKKGLFQTPTLPVLGLFAEDHLTYMKDRKSAHRSEPTLSEMTRFALEQLSKNENGFFLLVEGGRIDHAAHENRAAHAIEEVLEFDRAVQTAISEIRRHPDLSEKNTLVLVTADHETGGLAINDDPPLGQPLIARKTPEEKTPGGKTRPPYPVLSFATGPEACLTPGKKYASHTAVDVFGYGWGLQAESIHGTIENTDFFKIMKSLISAPGKTATHD